MKYRARIEKLDWRGKTVVSFREYEDEFKPNTFEALENFVKTGKLNTTLLGTPDVSYWDIRKKLAPQKSVHSFDDVEPGIRIIAGEHLAAAGVQYVVYNKDCAKIKGWVKTDTDLITGKGY